MSEERVKELRIQASNVCICIYKGIKEEHLKHYQFSLVNAWTVGQKLVAELAKNSSE